MSRSIRLFIVLTSILAGAFEFGGALANGGGAANMPAMSSAPMTPEQIAVADYNDGVKLIKDADEALADAAKATEPKKQQKARDHATKYFSKAQGKFESAVNANPDMYQAWNYVGYCKRNLGDYGGALDAYDRALQLNPRYFEAIEYRGHAYLGLARLDDAKQAYLDLFAGNRALADQLLVAMKSWVTVHRSDAQGVAGATVEDFARWVDERDSIAGKTAALAPQASSERWH